MSLGGVETASTKMTREQATKFRPFHKEFLVTFWRFALCDSGAIGPFKIGTALDPR